MELEVCILGSSSALPMVGRNPTSQFVTLANRHFLVDCGEGTQVQLRRNHIGFGRVNHIFISHLHGDHFFGLLPLLSTLHLLDRHKAIHLYCPEPLKEIIQTQMKLSEAWFRYPIHYHILRKEKQLLFEDDKVEVHAFPLQHSVDCWGFLFSEKSRQYNMKRSALRKYSIPVAEIRQIKLGADWVDEKGVTIPNQELTTAGPPSLSYAYCTDTAPLEHLETYFSKPDLLYHESTFTEEHSKRAKQTKHSTAKQAASVAKAVEAQHLLLGHYSTRYHDLQPLLAEAKDVFPASMLSKENHVYRIKAGQPHITETATLLTQQNHTEKA
jgi:ribonuclease Z